MTLLDWSLAGKYNTLGEVQYSLTKAEEYFSKVVKDLSYARETFASSSTRMTKVETAPGKEKDDYVKREKAYEDDLAELQKELKDFFNLSCNILHASSKIS